MKTTSLFDLLKENLMPRPGDIDLFMGFEPEAVRVGAEVIAFLLLLRLAESTGAAAFARVHVAVHVDHDASAVVDAVVERLAGTMNTNDTASIRRILEKRIAVAAPAPGPHNDLAEWWSAVPAEHAAVVIGVERFVVRVYT